MAETLEAARIARYVQTPTRANYVEVKLCQEFEKLLLEKPYLSSKFLLVTKNKLESKKGKAFAQMSVARPAQVIRPKRVIKKWAKTFVKYTEETVPGQDDFGAESEME
jgi:hypothetical protein